MDVCEMIRQKDVRRRKMIRFRNVLTYLLVDAEKREKIKKLPGGKSGALCTCLRLRQTEAILWSGRSVGNFYCT